MKALYKLRSMPLLLTPLLIVLVVMMVLPATLLAYGPTVDLLTTSNFAILAATTITNTGATTINGDVGLHPGTEFVNTGVTLNGIAYLTEAVALQAKNDLVTVYNDAAGRTPATDTFSGDNPLGGKTLTSGVYVLGEATTELSGTLTLDAQGDENAVFIFQVPSDLITASSSVVSLINGARFCRVFWVVPSSATLGEGSTFVGHILAMTSISVNSGVTVYGQLLARGGAVTLINDTITNGPCPTITPPAAAVAVDTSVYTITASTEGNGSITNPGVFNISAGQGLLYSITPGEGASIADVLVNGVSVGAVTSYTFLGVNSSQTIRAIFSETATEEATATPPAETPAPAAATTTTETTIEEAATEDTIAATTTAPVTPTVTGGQLPKTYTPWYNVLIAGAALTLIGAVVWWITRKKIHG